MINERVQIIEGASRRWHVTMQTAEGAPVDLSAYEFYGGAASRSRRVSHTMSVVGHTAAEVVLELPALPYGEWWHHQIYMREPATGREWLLVGGRIEVQERLGAPAGAQTVADAEAYLELTLGRSGVIHGSTLVAAGPPGPRGEKGESGQKQPYMLEVPTQLRANTVHDLGLLTADLDLSSLVFEEATNEVLTAELWFTTGSTVHTVTFPSEAIWVDLKPFLTTATAYRFAMRREPNGKLIINLAYEYTL